MGASFFRDTPHLLSIGIKANGDGSSMLLIKSICANWETFSEELFILMSLPFRAKADGITTSDSELKLEPINMTWKPSFPKVENVEDFPALWNLM